MDLKPTKPLSGFTELLPAQQRFFTSTVGKMGEKLRVAGFDFIDLPAIERAEVLVGDTDWSEIGTQMFLFEKGDTKMGLRYDGTVGLSRFVAGNLNSLTFPARLTQFSKRYRGERPQRGRYREFYQLDFDILGIGGLSSNYDAEIVKLACDIYDSIPELVGDYVINIGSRTFWNAFAKYLNLSSEQIDNTFILIDKKNKLDASDFESGLVESIGDVATKQILDVFINGPKALRGKSSDLDAAIDELVVFMDLLQAMNVSRAKLDLATMRGLGYYDGIVYEAVSKTYPEIGSIGGGGRYGNLVGRFSKTKIIGSGYAIGVTRMIMTALESGRIDLTKYENNIDVAVLAMGVGQVAYAMGVLATLRAANIVAVPYLDTDKKFKNQIEFADKIKAKFSMIVGEDEVKNQVVALKNMTTGEQTVLPLADAIKVVG